MLPGAVNHKFFCFSLLSREAAALFRGDCPPAGQALLLYNLLIKKINIKKPRFAPIWSQAAYSLAYGTFSNPNAQGYPQE